MKKEMLAALIGTGIVLLVGTVVPLLAVTVLAASGPPRPEPRLAPALFVNALFVCFIAWGVVMPRHVAVRRFGCSLFLLALADAAVLATTVSDAWTGLPPERLPGLAIAIGNAAMVGVLWALRSLPPADEA